MSIDKAVRIEGRPVSRTTYQRYGCRCAGCRAINSEYNKLNGHRWKRDAAERAAANARYREKHRAKIRDRSKEWARAAKLDANYRAAVNRRARMSFSRTTTYRKMQTQNESFKSTARRHGWLWTSTDLDLASRPDLSDEELAIRLGRTLFAVKTCRRRLREGDPRLTRLINGFSGETP